MRIFKILSWLPLLCLLAFSLYKAIQFPLHDFGNYYFGSYFFVKGEFNSALYDPFIFNQKVVEAGYADNWISYSPNPPFSSLMFIPLTWLDPHASKFIFNLVSIALFIITLSRLARHLSIPAHRVALVALIFFVPIYNNILFGQVYFLLLFLLVEGYLAMRHGHHIAWALLWGIAILFKLTPGILILFLLFNKEYKGFLLLTVTCAAMFLAALLINGFDVWEFYVREILPRANQGEVTAASFTINYQSAHMLFKYLFVQDALENPAPLLTNPMLFTTVNYLFKTMVVMLAALYTIRQRSVYPAWAIWILVSVLISPYGSTYAQIVLIIPLLIFYKEKIFIPIALLCLVFINIPIKYLADLPLLLQFPRLYLVLILFAVIIFQQKLEWHWRPVTIIAFLLLVPELFSINTQNDKSEYLLNTANHPLAHDYKIQDNRLSYAYWTPAGIKWEKTNLNVSSLSNTDVEIFNNQVVYHGKTLTASPDKKIRPSVLNDTTMIYLSDKGRGYGFYAFRKLSLK